MQSPKDRLWGKFGGSALHELLGDLEVAQGAPSIARDWGDWNEHLIWLLSMSEFLLAKREVLLERVHQIEPPAPDTASIRAAGERGRRLGDEVSSIAGRLKEFRRDLEQVERDLSEMEHCVVAAYFEKLEAAAREMAHRGESATD